jgi:hypothetical protein
MRGCVVKQAGNALVVLTGPDVLTTFVTLHLILVWGFANFGWTGR